MKKSDKRKQKMKSQSGGVSSVPNSDKIFYQHPIYTNYCANINGEIMHLKNKTPRKGNKHTTGYLTTSVSKESSDKPKSYFAHRFIWKCVNEIIPDDMVIDHVNDNKEDNRICNLQLMTQQQNCQKFAQHRHYSFPAKNHQNKKYVKAANCETNEITYSNSFYVVNQRLGINPGIVKMSAEGLNDCKTGISKKNNQAYKFEYIQKEDMPDNYLQSANIRPRKYTDEERKIIN